MERCELIVALFLLDFRFLCFIVRQVIHKHGGTVVDEYQPIQCTHLLLQNTYDHQVSVIVKVDLLLSISNDLGCTIKLVCVLMILVPFSQLAGQLCLFQLYLFFL